MAIKDIKHLAQILNNMKPAQREQLLSSLRQEDGPLAERLQSMLFTFGDIERLKGHDLQVLIKVCDLSDLATALIGAEEDTYHSFTQNMSKNAALLMADEIALIQNTPKHKVEAARQRIVKNAQKLAELGQISLEREGWIE